MQRKFIEYVRLQRRDGNRKYESLKNREREQKRSEFSILWNMNNTRVCPL